MSYSSIHKDYLESLKERRQDPFYRQQARWLIRKTAPEYQRTARKYETYLRKEDLPESIKAQATIEQQQRWADVVGGVSDKMEMQEANRRKQLEQEIDVAEKKYELAKEKEEQQEKDIFGNIVSTVGSLAGAGVSLIPGGQSIGMGISAASAGIGSAVSGSPEQQMALLDRAGTEALGAMSSAATLSKDKERTESIQNMTKLAETSNLSQQEKNDLYNYFSMNLNAGVDPDTIIESANELWGLGQSGANESEFKPVSPRPLSVTNF